MAKKHILQTDGHEITVSVKGSRYLVDVNSQPFTSYQVGTVSFWLGHNEDFPLNLDGRQLMLVVRKRAVRLAENGVYLDNGEPYEMLAPLPKWISVFIVLNALVVIGLGLIPFLLAVLGIGGCVGIARNRKFGAGTKVGLCILVTAVVWALFALLLFASLAVSR